MTDPIPILKRSPLFRDLPEGFLRETLLPLGAERRFAKNEALITEGERVDWFGVVLTGRVQVVQLFASGNSSLMENLLPSWAVGVDLVFTRSRRAPYSAAAGLPSAVLAFPARVLTGEDVLPEAERLLVWRGLLELLSQANMRKHNRLAMLAQRGLRDRIATYLSLQATRREEDSFQISFSREELADFLCVNRSALSHELSLMEQEGLIRFRKNRFTLLGPEEKTEPAPAGADEKGRS